MYQNSRSFIDYAGTRKTIAVTVGNSQTFIYVTYSITFRAGNRLGTFLKEVSCNYFWSHSYTIICDADKCICTFLPGSNV